MFTLQKENEKMGLSTNMTVFKPERLFMSTVAGHSQAEDLMLELQGCLKSVNASLLCKIRDPETWNGDVLNGCP